MQIFKFPPPILANREKIIKKSVRKKNSMWDWDLWFYNREITTLNRCLHPINVINSDSARQALSFDVSFVKICEASLKLFFSELRHAREFFLIWPRRGVVGVDEASQTQAWVQKRARKALDSEIAEGEKGFFEKVSSASPYDPLSILVTLSLW